jgi:hypothetical protein
MPRPTALSKARQATAGALLAATLLTGGVVVHLADASSGTVAASRTSGTGSSSDSSSTTLGFGSTSNVASSAGAPQSNTSGS